MAEAIELAENRTFPPPPPFYKSFTKNNLEALKELRDRTNADDSANGSRPVSETLQSIQVPEDLRHLVPPALPEKEEKYRVFTSELDVSGVIPTLASLSIEQLFPSPSLAPSTETDVEWTVDRVYYLKKLIRSIMLNFLELIGILSTDPAQWLEKFEALKVLFYNAHSLVNEYRDHQARETLITMLEAQVEEKRKEVVEIRSLQGKIAGIMEGMRKDAPKAGGLNGEAVNGTAGNIHRAVDRRKREQRSMWQALDAEVGN